jgi:hypothetical protein
MANLLNDEQKLFRVHGDVAGPVANLTGRARQYKRPDYTRTGEAGAGYTFKNHLRDEARRVGESYGTGPAGYQNFMPRTSLIDSKGITNIKHEENEKKRREI